MLQIIGGCRSVRASIVMKTKQYLDAGASKVLLLCAGQSTLLEAKQRISTGALKGMLLCTGDGG